jgi:hypothetical protein
MFGDTPKAGQSNDSQQEHRAMTASNVSRFHQYLQAVASMGAPETVADFFASDVIFQEFPNRIALQGRVGRFADLHAAYERGRKILQSQRYDVQRIDEIRKKFGRASGC